MCWCWCWGRRGKGVGDYDYESTTDENLQMGLTKLFKESSRMMEERKEEGIAEVSLGCREFGRMGANRVSGKLDSIFFHRS